MPDPNVTLTALRDELVAAGLVRRPGVAGPLPPLFVEPMGGPPAPGEREGSEAGDDLVATLRHSGELAAGFAGSGRRTIIAELTYRSRGTPGLKAGRELDAAIREALVERADYGLGLTLGASGPRPVLVLQASVFAGLGPVSDLEGVRTERAAYALETLAG